MRPLLILLACSWLLPTTVSAGDGPIAKAVRRHVRNKQFNYRFSNSLSESLGYAVKAGLISKRHVRQVHVLNGEMKIGLGRRAIMKRQLKKDAAKFGVALKIVPKKVTKWETTYDVEIASTKSKKVDKFATHMLEYGKSKGGRVVSRRDHGNTLQGIGRGLEVPRSSKYRTTKQKREAKQQRRANNRQAKRKRRARREAKTLDIRTALLSKGKGELAVSHSRKKRRQQHKRQQKEQSWLGAESDGNLEQSPHRTENQDAMGAVESPQEDLLLFVADGAGGHEGGREAAWTGAAEVVKSFRSSTETTAEARLLETIHNANNKVRKGQETGEKMGVSTFTGLVITKKGKVLTGNAGDSRVYRSRKDKLEQLTLDHSAGGSTITQYLGFKEGNGRRFEPVVREHGKVRSGDQYLVCSDGLHGFVSDKAIAKVMNTDLSPQQKARALIKAAKKAGANDNITVQVYIHP